LEDHSRSEADARWTPRNLARTGRLQHQYDDERRRRDHLDRGGPATATLLDQFLTEGLALLRSEQGLERYGELRTGLPLSDRHGALPEPDGGRCGHDRQSEPAARAGPDG